MNLRIAVDIGLQGDRCVVLAYDDATLRVVAHAEIWPAELDDANGDPFTSIIAFQCLNELCP